MSLENISLTEAERIQKAEELLEIFQSYSNPDPISVETNPMTLSQLREPIIRQLGELECFDAAKPIFEYLQKTRIPSELIAGIEVLGNLGYTKAIPFIEAILIASERWHTEYGLNLMESGIGLVKKEIEVSKRALDRLRPLYQDQEKKQGPKQVVKPDKVKDPNHPTFYNNHKKP